MCTELNFNFFMFTCFFEIIFFPQRVIGMSKTRKGGGANLFPTKWKGIWKFFLSLCESIRSRKSIEKDTVFLKLFFHFHPYYSVIFNFLDVLKQVTFRNEYRSNFRKSWQLCWNSALLILYKITQLFFYKKLLKQWTFTVIKKWIDSGFERVEEVSFSKNNN